MKISTSITVVVHVGGFTASGFFLPRTLGGILAPVCTCESLRVKLGVELTPGEVVPSVLLVEGYVVG